MDQTGAKELTKPAWPQVLQQTHSDKACVGHQASRFFLEAEAPKTESLAY